MLNWTPKEAYLLSYFAEIHCLESYISKIVVLKEVFLTASAGKIEPCPR